MDGCYIMTEHNLKVNQNFELVVKNSSFEGTYLCKITDICDNKIKITAPYIRGEIIPLRINLALEMYFTGEKAAYLYKTKIIGRESEPIPVLVLEYPDNKQRIQRREFFRLDAKIGLTYRLLNSDLEPVTEMKETITIDISGGGLKMVFDNAIYKGSLMELYLQIPGIENISIISKVVNVFELPEGIAVGVKFVEIDNYVQEQIIGWIFDYQRELRKKGML